MKVKEKVLEHEKRREIYEYLKENPGLHMREIQRRMAKGDNFNSFVGGGMLFQVFS
jgi:predicted transcriptional regulator